jgi:protein-disulfide isomerase
MKQSRLWLLTAALVLSLIACGERSHNQTDGTKIDANWFAQREPNLRRILGLPPELKLEFREARTGAMPDYDQVEFSIGEEGGELEQLTLYVSRDGQHVLYDDRVYDIADPFRTFRQQIRLETVPSRGPAGAPVMIVEYSDFTCGYCRLFFHSVEKPLFERFGGQIRHVFKNFPLIGMRPYAASAALAGACAFRQGNDQFWAMRAQLFSHPELLVHGKSALEELARQARLDLVHFKRCLDRQEGLADVERDVEEGERLEIEGTPSFFINGRPVPGLPGRDYFFHIIEEELAAAKN